MLARLNVGGPAIHVTLITERLGPPEYESTLVTGTVSGAEGDMSYYAAEHGVTPIYIPTLGRELHPIRGVLPTALQGTRAGHTMIFPAGNLGEDALVERSALVLMQRGGLR